MWRLRKLAVGFEVRDDFFTSLSELFPILTYLDVGDRNEISSSTFVYAVQRFKHLRTLRIRGSRSKIDDTGRFTFCHFQFAK